jgi:hypothetical protein
MRLLILLVWIAQVVTARLLYAEKGELECIYGYCSSYEVEVVDCIGGEWNMFSQAFDDHLVCTVIQAKSNPLMIFVPIAYKCDGYLAVAYDYPCQLVYLVDTIGNMSIILSMLAENLILMSFILTMAIGLTWTWQVVCSGNDDDSSSDVDKVYEEMA